MTRLLLASGNAKKLAELCRLVDGHLDVVGLDELPGGPDVAETERTFAGNALLKARAHATFSGLPTVADDSGLCVNELGGMPGVRSARWSGPDASDEANNALLLAQLDDVPDERRGARFVSAVALVTPDGAEHVETGEMAGRVLVAPRGDGGFGYDPIFAPEGETRSAAELTPQEKDAISHRGRALRALLPRLLALGEG